MHASKPKPDPIIPTDAKPVNLKVTPISHPVQAAPHSHFEHNRKPFENFSDRDLWEALKDGDESAFIFIYTRFFQPLMNYGLQFSNETSLIEDGIQDLFVELRKKRKNLGTLRTSIKLYLFICLKRRILEYKKRSERNSAACREAFREFEIIAPVETHLINESILKEQKLRLNRAMENLTAKQREVIYYLYYQDLSYKEIKELMGLENVKSVRNILYKALGAMKVIMKMMCWALFWTALKTFAM